MEKSPLHKHPALQECLYYWLLTIALGHCFLGLMFIFLVHGRLFDPYFDSLYLLFSVDKTVSIDWLTRTMLQFLGPTISSWGLLLYLAVYSYRQFGLLKQKIFVIAALSIWFVSDTVISLNNGIVVHVVLNSIVFLTILIPFIFLRPNLNR